MLTELGRSVVIRTSFMVDRFKAETQNVKPLSSSSIQQTVPTRSLSKKTHQCFVPLVRSCLKINFIATSSCPYSTQTATIWYLAQDRLSPQICIRRLKNSL